MQDDVVALFAYDRWANRNELFDFAWRWHEVLIWHLNSFLRPLAIGLGILQSS